MSETFRACRSPYFGLNFLYQDNLFIAHVFTARKNYQASQIEFESLSILCTILHETLILDALKKIFK